MGYWNQTPKGGSLQPANTGLVWGDAPADIIGGAIREVIRVGGRTVYVKSPSIYLVLCSQLV